MTHEELEREVIHLKEQVAYLSELLLADVDEEEIDQAEMQYLAFRERARAKERGA